MLYSYYLCKEVYQPSNPKTVRLYVITISLNRGGGGVEISSFYPEFVLTGVTFMHLYRLGE